MVKPAYLDYQFQDSPSFVRTFDELPLWSAPFGMMLLQHVPLRRGITVLDIGSGAGFPLLELAQRLGPSCKCYGLDPWTNANARAREKIGNYGICNTEVIDGSAVAIPLADESADLIVSNLGINNFDDPPKMFGECLRVLKPGGRLAITTNLNGHWQQFYDVLEQTLMECGRDELLPALAGHQEHRGTVASISKLFTDGGFAIVKAVEDRFEMRFLDGTAMLNHYFVKLGWLASWKELVPRPLHEEVFSMLEGNLNAYAAAQGGLKLTVPMAYIEGEKG